MNQTCPVCSRVVDFIPFWSKPAWTTRITTKHYQAIQCSTMNSHYGSALIKKLLRKWCKARCAIRYYMIARHYQVYDIEVHWQEVVTHDVVSSIWYVVVCTMSHVVCSICTKEGNMCYILHRWKISKYKIQNTRVRCSIWNLSWRCKKYFIQFDILFHLQQEHLTLLWLVPEAYPNWLLC